MVFTCNKIIRLYVVTLVYFQYYTSSDGVGGRESGHTGLVQVLWDRPYRHKHGGGNTVIGSNPSDFH